MALSRECALVHLLKIRKIVETSIYVKDLQRSESFYTELLGLDLVTREPGRHVFLKSGKSMLLIFNASVTLAEANLAFHGTTGPSHFAFEIYHADYESWKQKLESSRVHVEKEVTWPSGARSLYFRDPDQHSVELITEGNWPVED